MVVAILLNAVCMFIEEQYRNSDNDKDAFWISSDFTFTLIFTIEAAMKLLDMGCNYFFDLSNVFDFCLVLSGLVGLLFELLAFGFSDYSSEGRLVRIARVFRVLRLIRLFRLWKLLRGVVAVILHQEELLEIQEHLSNITMLTHFARAQIYSQHQLIDYFGTEGEVDTVEVARVILQSKVAAYRAVCMAVQEERMTQEDVLKGVCNVRETQAMADELEAFVLEAQKGGVLSNLEARTILRPLRHHVKAQLREMHSSMKRQHFVKVGKNAPRHSFGRLVGVSSEHSEVPIEGRALPVVPDSMPTDGSLSVVRAS
jgi:hypothetical protein